MFMFQWLKVNREKFDILEVNDHHLWKEFVLNSYCYVAMTGVIFFVPVYMHSAQFVHGRLLDKHHYCTIHTSFISIN
jgi:hypothetical protein